MKNASEAIEGALYGAIISYWFMPDFFSWQFWAPLILICVVSSGGEVFRKIISHQD